MNLQAESHFSVNPTDLDIGRSRFERPQNLKFTFNTGDLVPFFWTEILPGDTVQMKHSAVIRMSTPLDPVLDNLYCDINWFFVPMRLTWTHTKEFFGEPSASAWTPSTTYSIPQLTYPTSGAGAAVQTVSDYMGIPLGVTGISVSQLPFRAYALIYNDWWRDENLVTPPTVTITDTGNTYASAYPHRGGYPFKVAKMHDYFTSCLPGPQRGNSVLIPFTGSGTVSIAGTFPVNAASTLHSMGNPIMVSDSSSGFSMMRSNGGIGGEYQLSLTDQSSAPSGFTKLNYSNLVASVNGSGSVSGISSTTSVNDLRMAFQMQKWYEKSAMYGGRYVEMLKAQFGVTSPDARLQRTEYLGGKRIPIQVHQVENQTASTSTPLGHLGAFSHTVDADEDFTHSFTEHGFLFGTICARYNHTYSQGINKEFSRTTMFDYYFPVFANLGNMPVLTKEIYADGSSNDNNVFGYQEAWAEYRYLPDRVSGYMRPGISGSLASWHYADYYTSTPTLSASWIEEDVAPVDRTLAAAHTTTPQLLADVLVDSVWVRAMPVYSIPGLIDHH